MLDIRWSIGLAMKCLTWYHCILATENTPTNRTINRNLRLLLLHFAVLMAKRNMCHVHRDQRLVSYLYGRVYLPVRADCLTAHNGLFALTGKLLLPIFIHSRVCHEITSTRYHRKCWLFD